MFNRKFCNGGFVLVEFAIALPLLILLTWGLAQVSKNIFQLGKEQLADYTSEAEAQYVMERITHQARAAKSIEIKKFTAKIHQLKIVYHTVNDDSTNPILNVADIWETQYFIPRKDSESGNYVALNAKRQELGALTNPITGGNSFGDTKINILQYDPDEQKKILHITLELESVVSGKKIKLVTSVFMPGCEKFK